MKTRQGFAEAEGHRLAYLAVNEHLDNADEPAIVFIHGVLVSVNFWRDCVPESFRDSKAWYSLSLPAHYPSTAPEGFDARQVDDAWFFRVMNGALQHMLGNRKIIVVGHSTGGFSALNLAAHHAPNVAGIVSVAGFHLGRWGGVEGQLLRLAGLGAWGKGPFITNLLISKKSRRVRRLFASFLAYRPAAYRASPLSRKMLDNVEADMLKQDPGALFALFGGITTLAIGDRLDRIQIPCYLLAGSNDPVVTSEQSLLLAGRIPRSRLVVFPNVGHMPFIEDPDAYAEALERALEELAAGTKFSLPKAVTRQELSHELSRV
ncbi:pimeloyl-ACP methyl ester carboxylesterase [Fluviicoccus keumensis]|uniref:Pimeloyl-ACP methyl ester carboxylesterase n=1 Tax=Fluviicoccus keumensis TaxID=1435465 RepID=A0A4V2G6A5_9GAMM|nr:alpha/beta hydrolase [Fluviicoccus keumensis]RZU47926.1 pimeloyl-ACP methyl ester carboxylesterase [Fluviicoccus keumensis]